MDQNATARNAIDQSYFERLGSNKLCELKVRSL